MLLLCETLASRLSAAASLNRISVAVTVISLGPGSNPLASASNRGMEGGSATHWSSTRDHQGDANYTPFLSLSFYFVLFFVLFLFFLSFSSFLCLSLPYFLSFLVLSGILFMNTSLVCVCRMCQPFCFPVFLLHIYHLCSFICSRSLLLCSL